MRFWTTCFAAAVCGCFIVGAPKIGHADTVIFNNFGPGNTFDTTTSWIVSGLSSTSGIAFAPAMPFSSPVEADITQIDIAMANHAGSNAATVTLFSNTGGALGTMLGSWAVSNILNINGGGPSVLTISGISGVHLNAGGNYFLQASASGDADNGWYVNSIGQTGTLLILRSDTLDPVLQQGTLGAFNIIGTPTVVPIPAALPLFATGLGVLGLLGWRRKRKISASV